MLKTIALDDEPLALKIIESFCEQISDVQLEKVFTSQTDALKYIRKYPVDLLFLDIQMPKKNGVDFYRNLDYHISVIFTTAFQDFAVEGFNLDAVDYLIKPFTQERFEEAVKKAVLRSQILSSSNVQNFILIRSNYKLNKVFFDDILFIQALDNYIIITLKSEQKLTVQMTMKDIVMKLSEMSFMRIHRSYIINTKYIETISQKSVQINGIILPIGEKHKADLLKFL